MTAPPPVSPFEPQPPQWAPPGHPPVPTPPPDHLGTALLPPHQPRDGMGTAALVIGSIGSFVAFIPFLFWVAGILGILAVVFGLIGYRTARKGLATNKTSALGGAALGGIALVLAVVMAFVAATFVRNVAHQAEEETERPIAPYTAPEEEPEPLDNELVDDAPVEFGEPRNYAGGVQLTVARPDEFSPDGRIIGVHVGDRAIRIRMTIVNNSDEPLDLTALPHVEDANGKDIDPLFGTRAGNRPFDGILAPGARATAQYPYVLPPNTAKELRVEVAASLGYEDGTWTGPVG
ncbi:DUF4190 domain-containing protein [Streptomyces sp. NPDC096354]|uniref:DUF4190 domain-containing protein n=1 Tax=Streptomyces sp. NPDC096354 TaxID=3366088 RepID=UPI0038011ED6